MKRLFDQLYRECGGTVELRAILDGTQTKTAFFKIGDYDGMKAFTRQHNKANLFFGVATRDGHGGGKEHLVSIPAVYVDIDFKNTPVKKARELYQRFPFKASAIVRSGNGIHPYWILREPADKTDIDQVEDVNSRICSALEADTTGTEAARILRIPGTTNKKYKPPRRVELLQLDDYRYNLEDFEVLPPAPNTTRPATRGSAPGEMWIEALMQGMAEGTKTNHADGRNHAGIRLAGYFVKRHPIGIVRSILENWNLRNTPPLSPGELDHILRNARRYSPAEQRTDHLMDEYQQWCREHAGGAEFEALDEAGKVKLFKQERQQRHG